MAGYEVSGGRLDRGLGGCGWAKTPEDALLVLLAHSPDDGEIWPAQAEPLANRLEELLPAISRESGMDDIYSCFAATTASGGRWKRANPFCSANKGGAKAGKSATATEMRGPPLN